MTGFIQNLIHRQTQTVENVKPRVRSIFEPEVISARMPPAYKAEELENRAENPPALTAPGGDIVTSQTAAEPNKITGKSINPSTGKSREPVLGQEEPLPFSPVIATTHNESWRKHDQKEKEDKPSDGIIKPALRLSGEHTQVNNPHGPDQQEVFNNLFKNEYEMKNAIKTNQADFPPDPGQLSLINYTLRSAEGSIKPAIKTATNFKSTPFESTRSEFNGLLGTPPGLRNFSNADAESLPKTDTPPAIKVTIGRIEVRAVSSPVPPATPAKAAPKPALSLDDYLQRRNERK